MILLTGGGLSCLTGSSVRLGDRSLSLAWFRRARLLDASFDIGFGSGASSASFSAFLGADAGIGIGTICLGISGGFGCERKSIVTGSFVALSILRLVS